MSCMGGMWNFDGKPVDRYFLGKLGASIVQYGPDQADERGLGGPSEYVDGNIAMIYRPFHTNKESRLERQPYVSKRGNVMTWDGRLDNRAELMRALAYELSTEHSRTLVNSGSNYTDVAIVMAAWEAWGTECFKKLIGDFSLAVWSPADRTLTLAKDFIGVRYLYYELIPEGMAGAKVPEGMRGGARSDPELGDAEPPSGPCVWWCSRLEPLILLSGRQYEINEEYIAGYFAFHPANHITPYVGVDALPAGHYAQIRRGQKKLVQYWHFDPEKRITYKTDAEYEEHFRQVFFQSVKRRLRADAPVVAGLSGGRDSSAIVCVADELIARGEAETPRLDTYSRYDEEEPFQDDYRYLTVVEQKRGRTGHHITHNKDSSLATSHSPLATAPKRLRALELDYFSAHPGIDQEGAEDAQQRMEFMKTNGYRIILSGIGGDEMTGGVPYCVSELADLLVQGRLLRLAAQTKAWGLAQKEPTLHLLLRTIRRVKPNFLNTVFRDGIDVWPWADRNFVRRHSRTFGSGTRICMAREGLPSFRSNVGVAAGVAWQLASVAKLHRRGAKENCYGRGFAFLDRDFLEFMFAIPREQVLRPGQHRSLMRRALAGIVPKEILNRTRKAFAARRPALGIEAVASEIGGLLVQPLGETFGWMNPVEFLRAVDDLGAGKNNLIRPIQKTAHLEMWSRSLAERGILQGTSVPCESTEKVFEGAA